MNGKKITWRVKRIHVIDISVRSRREGGLEIPYAVFGCSGNKKGKKDFCLMCFDQSIFNRVLVDDYFTFEGFVSFAPGATFFVVDKCYDILGLEIQSENSPYDTLDLPF